VIRASVVVPAYRSHETLGATLRALREQTVDHEVIVVDSSPDHETSAAVAPFGEVRLVRSSERLWPHAARNRGAAVASAPVLVFTDPDCVPAPDWLAGLLAAHEAGHEIAGGPIVVPPTSDWRKRAIHATKFVSVAPRRPAGTGFDLASGNLSLTRPLFDRLGGFDEIRPWAGDTDLARRAGDLGAKPWFVPDAIIVHDDRPTIAGFLRERRGRGEEWADWRAQRGGWRTHQRIARAAAFPLTAAVLVARAARACDGRPGPAELALIVAGCAAWAGGEARGLVRFTR
jgi:GT2 family glycosyltransferase